MSYRPTEQPTGPRRSVAGYSSYQEAERAVDWLSDQGFAIDRVSIVGTGLRYVEQVAGRVTTVRAALIGAGQGLFIGLIFALFFGLFFTGPDFLGVLLYGLIAGAILGVIFGAVAHSAMGGRRDFASIAHTEADRYEVLVDHEVAGEAERLLSAMPAASS